MTETPQPVALVVDDEPVVLGAIERILRTAGFTVLSAESAEAGMELLRDNSVSLVVCDLILSGMSGLKFVSLALEHDPQVAVIMTTGYSTAENAIASLQEGAFDYLPKPFTANELLSPVKRARQWQNLAPAVRRKLESGVGDVRYLGRNSWARLEKDGTARLGISTFMLGTADPVVEIDFPSLNSTLAQGERLVRFTTTEGLGHRVWSALSGRVVGTNEAIAETPDRLIDDPLGEWLVQIEPSQVEVEWARLSPASGRI